MTIELSEIAMVCGKTYFLDEDWASVGAEVQDKIILVHQIEAGKVLPPGTEFSVIVIPRGALSSTGSGGRSEVTAVSWVYPARRDEYLEDGSLGFRVVAGVAPIASFSV